MAWTYDMERGGPVWQEDTTPTPVPYDRSNPGRPDFSFGNIFATGPSSIPKYGQHGISGINVPSDTINYLNQTYGTALQDYLSGRLGSFKYPGGGSTYDPEQGQMVSQPWSGGNEWMTSDVGGNYEQATGPGLRLIYRPDLPQIGKTGWYYGGEGSDFQDLISKIPGLAQDPQARPWLEAISPALQSAYGNSANYAQSKARRKAYSELPIKAAMGIAAGGIAGPILGGAMAGAGFSDNPLKGGLIGGLGGLATSVLGGAVKDAIGGLGGNVLSGLVGSGAKYGIGQIANRLSPDSTARTTGAVRDTGGTPQAPGAAQITQAPLTQAENTPLSQAVTSYNEPSGGESTVQTTKPPRLIRLAPGFRRGY